MNNAATCLVLSSFILAAPIARALPEDRDQPLAYDAVKGEIQVEENLMILEGTQEKPVIVTQGTLRVTGLNLEGRGIINQDIPAHLTASGSPASFQMQPRADGGLLHGSGNTLVYDESGDLFILLDQSSLDIDGHRVTGDRIEYLITPSVITATAADPQSLVFVQVPTDEGLMTGHARMAVYDEGRGIVTLEGAACLQLQDVVFRGYYATFDLNTGRGSARGENDDDVISVNQRNDACE